MVHGSAGAPGLIGVWPAHQRPHLRMAKDNPFLVTHNGAKIQLFAAQKAERFRGPAGDKAWFDELDSWKPEGMTPREAFGLAEQRIRTGPNPQIIGTTTPKRRGLVQILSKRSDCVVTRASMYDNASNLAPSYIRAMRDEYEGTRVGRQELYGEILPDVEGAIVNLEMIDAQRVGTAPDLLRVVVGVDPFGGGGDACGIGAAAKGVDSSSYVLADRTCKLGPDGWARRVIETAVEFDADCIVWEANFGGEMVPTVLNHTMQKMGVTVRLKRVWSSRGKHLRFEPIGAMYERGEIHHVGTFDALEDELTQFTPDGYDGEASPNRADAMVFALAELNPPKPLIGWDDVTTEDEGARA